MEESKYIVISLGGSLIVPDEIDISFLKSFTTLIKEYTEKGARFVIITGGGKLCRRYNDVASQLGHPSKDDLDWLGIAITRTNAELVRIAFGDFAHNVIAMDPNIIPETTKSIIVGGGWKPGNSSDLAAIQSAANVGARKVVNLSNIDFAYDKDPNKYPDAKKIEQTTWAEFRRVLPPVWEPGLSSPFDPVAAERAQILGLEVAIMNGKNLDNLKKYLDGEAFLGTVIK